MSTGDAIQHSPGSAPATPRSALYAPRSALYAPLSTLPGPVIGLLAVLGLFIVLIGAKGELHNFLSPRNLQVLIHEGNIPAIAALGALLIIISGGIDLSVGSVMALVMVVTMQTYNHLYQGPESVGTASAAAVLAGVAAGGLCGAVNGFVITRLRVVPFVATLGMLSVARGLAIWLSGRTLIAFRGDSRPGWVDALAQVHPPTFFNPGFWLLAVLALGVAVLLRSTVLGRYAYAIGSNEQTARLCGVPVARSKVTIYTLAGILAGLAGVLMFAHGGSGDPSGAEGMELDVIAAVVVGGAALTGGRGTVAGTLLGVLILQVLHNGVSVFNVPVEIRLILIGVIIVVNTALGQWRQERTV